MLLFQLAFQEKEVSVSKCVCCSAEEIEKAIKEILHALNVWLVALGFQQQFVRSVWLRNHCSCISFQRLIYTQEYTIGTSETVLIREVSL